MSQRAFFLYQAISASESSNLRHSSYESSNVSGGNLERAESISVEEPSDYDNNSRNMSEIIPGVFLGPNSAAKRSRLNELKNRGITRIIYVTENTEIEAPFIVDLNYINLNIADSVHENIKRHFTTVIEFIDDCLERNGKVLVVGTNGISRSATLVIAYVMKKHDLTYKEAYTLVKSKRCCIQPNKGFMDQLNIFETYKDEQPSTPRAITPELVNSNPESLSTFLARGGRTFYYE